MRRSLIAALLVSLLAAACTSEQPALPTSTAPPPTTAETTTSTSPTDSTNENTSSTTETTDDPAEIGEDVTGTTQPWETTVTIERGVFDAGDRIITLVAPKAYTVETLAAEIAANATGDPVWIARLARTKAISYLYFIDRVAVNPYDGFEETRWDRDRETPVDYSNVFPSVRENLTLEVPIPDISKVRLLEVDGAVTLVLADQQSVVYRVFKTSTGEEICCLDWEDQRLALVHYMAERFGDGVWRVHGTDFYDGK